MGTQCSNLLNNLSHQTPSRNKLLEFISNPLTSDKNNSHESGHDFNLGSKLDFIRQIQKQFIREGDKNILSFQKYPQNRFVVKFGDGSHYRGYIDAEGKREKEGQQTWQDGTKYLGEWKENLPNGNGILISPEGYTFEGSWNQGVVQGFGKYFGRIGSYQGDWFHNQPHGNGFETWQDGSQYEGIYFQGKKHGKGKYIWPDKSTYIGDWTDGKITGQGTYRYIDGRVYTGSFRNNKMHGKGSYTWPDGRKYIGYYQEDKKSGTGRYIWPDGRYYEGEWADGKRNGYGKVVYQNKVVKYGIWQDDRKVEEAGEGNGNFGLWGNSSRQEEENSNQKLQESPTFMSKRSPSTKGGSHHPTLPRTEPRPLYASSLSPYKHLKHYYEHSTVQRGDMNQRVANRYRFIESPLKKFNETQLSGSGSYLRMMERKKTGARASLGKFQENRTGIKPNTRDSAFL